jgi:hypothetical protein
MLQYPSTAQIAQVCRVVLDGELFREEYSHNLPLESHGMKTPAELYYCEPTEIPEGQEIVTPYVKDGQIRMKFTNRHGKSARAAIALNLSPTTYGPSINPYQTSPQPAELQTWWGCTNRGFFDRCILYDPRSAPE